MLLFNNIVINVEMAMSTSSKASHWNLVIILNRVSL